MKHINDCFLYRGDCLKVMKKIPNNSVDLILCDLPYGTTGIKWDKVIPYKELFKEYERVLTSNGNIVLFGSEPFSTKLRNAGKDYYKYDLYWIKNRVTGFANAKIMPLKNIELISVFSKGSISHEGKSKNKMVYNPQGLKKVSLKKENHKRTDKSFTKQSLSKTISSSDKEYVQEYTNYPTMVLTFDSCQGEFHPTQKPIQLLEYLIKTFSNEKATVLDNTMGSGSTGVACQNINRKFIGIEMDKKYFKIACERIRSNKGTF